MTVAAIPAVVEYLENGVTTSFAVPFRFLANADLVVTRKLAGVVSTVAPTGYAGTGGEGGSITIATSIAGARLRIKRRTPRTQPTDYTPGDRFPAETHEAALDRRALVEQEIDADLIDTRSRALIAPEGETFADLPSAALRAGRFLAFGVGGVPALSTGTGIDTGLRVDLATDGGAHVGVAPERLPLGPLIRIDDAFEFGVRLTRYGYVGNGSHDDTQAWRDAVEEADARGIQRIIVPAGESLVTGAIVNGKLPMGLTFDGEGPRSRNESHAGPRLIYTGSGTCWFVNYPDFNPVTAGGWRWRNLAMKATNAAATMFDFNNCTDHNPVDGTGASYLIFVEFEGCYLSGAQAGVLQTGDGIRAAKVFSMHIDKQCQIRDWRRGVWLNGCDDCTIEGRIWLNAQSARVENNGTFGSNNQIRSNWLGRCPADNSETPYILYDTSSGLACHGTFFEGHYGSEDALIYLGGYNTTLIGNRFADGPMFRLAPGARNINIISPDCPAYNAGWAPKIDAPLTWDFGFGQEDYRALIVGASKNIVKMWGANPRLIYRSRYPQAFDGIGGTTPVEQDVEMLADDKGVRPRRRVLTALNSISKNDSTLVDGGIADMPVDSGASTKYAIKLNHATTAAGLQVSFVIGTDFMVADRVKVTLRGKSASATGWELYALKNGVFSAAVLGPITGASFASFTGSIDLSTWTVGDVLSFAVLKASTPTATCAIDYIEFAVVAAQVTNSTLAVALTDPAGGATIDSQSRTAIAAQRAAMQAIETKLNSLIAAQRGRGEMA